MNVLPRRQFGDPILRKKAKAIPQKSVHTKEVQALIKKMHYTLSRIPGVGLAAPQIGESRRLFVANVDKDDVRAKGTLLTRATFINPKIVKRSKAMQMSWEGCLSLPAVRAQVPRHRSVMVEWFDEQGERHTQEFKGFLACLVQHEIDHLDGILFLDRVENTKTIMTAQEFEKRILNT